VAEKFGRSDWAEVCGGEYFGYYVQQAVNGPRITEEIAEIEAALGAPEALAQQDPRPDRVHRRRRLRPGHGGPERQGRRDLLRGPAFCEREGARGRRARREDRRCREGRPRDGVINHQLIPFVDPKGALRAAGLVKVIQ
jgi:hypothetical protein